MATVNIFHDSEHLASHIQTKLPELKSCIARELTCDESALTADVISVRLIKVHSLGMIAPIEVEITAHAFEGRIERQDEICLHVREFLQHQLTDVRDVRVWLLLPQLGHSWE